MKRHSYEETDCFFLKDMSLWKDMLNEQYKRRERKSFFYHQSSSHRIHSK